MLFSDAWCTNNYRAIRAYIVKVVWRGDKMVIL